MKPLTVLSVPLLPNTRFFGVRLTFRRMRCERVFDPFLGYFAHGPQKTHVPLLDCGEREGESSGKDPKLRIAPGGLYLGNRVGGGVTPADLPHHLAYGSVPRRFLSVRSF
jgi:hypothetical protein